MYKEGSNLVDEMYNYIGISNGFPKFELRWLTAVKEMDNIWFTKYTIKIELRSFKSSEHINEGRDGPYHGFGYLSLFSDPLDLAKWGQREIL